VLEDLKQEIGRTTVIKAMLRELVGGKLQGAAP